MQQLYMALYSMSFYIQVLEMLNAVCDKTQFCLGFCLSHTNIIDKNAWSQR